MSERQTLSYLARRFEEQGMEPKTKYGQNFLIDLNLLDMIHNTAAIDKQDVVLEVGTGMGSLTTRMAPKAGWVVTIEIDSQLQVLANHELNDHSNVTLMTCDALRNKNHLREEILDEIRQRMAAIPNSRLKLVANLPYNVATPIISNLLTVEPVVDRMVVTIQKELAERITASPSTKDYSALSIWMQSQCDCRIVRVMPPSVFWPRPRVDSAILEMVVNHDKRNRIRDREFFHEKLRALFFHRRKFIRSQLAIALQPEFSKEQVDDLLASHGIDHQVRAEQLTVEQIIALLEDVSRLNSNREPSSPA